MKRFAVFVGVLTLWITAAASPAHAKSKPKTFVVAVPFDFVVGNRTMPAGSYRFQLVLGSPTQNDTGSVLAVRSVDGRYYASTFTAVTQGDAPSDGPKLVFSRAGDRASLSQLWEQGNAVGLKLRIAPAETEMAAQQDDEVLTLIPSR